MRQEAPPEHGQEQERRGEIGKVDHEALPVDAG
jgi:hypothetical protein